MTWTLWFGLSLILQVTVQSTIGFVLVPWLAVRRTLISSEPREAEIHGLSATKVENHQEQFQIEKEDGSIFDPSTSNNTKSVSPSDHSDPTRNHPPIRLDPFLARVVQLHEYKQIHGDVNVPKRYQENPSLGHWVNKQRQLYKKYLANEKPCALTPSRVETLNILGFVWDAIKLQHTKKSAEDEELFWTIFQELKERIEPRVNSMYNETTGAYVESESMLIITKEIAAMKAFSEIPAKSELGLWLARQRKEYSRSENDNRSSSHLLLDEDKIKALNSLSKNWQMTPRERSFELNFALLKAYKKVYGDTLVPISFPSRRLANWVSTQRKNYNSKMAGEKSDLTDERLSKLESVGFIWNRWEYEFEQKGVA